MRRVLVAGATGYLGKYVVREFKRRGYWVRALVRRKSLKKLDEVGPFLEPAIKEYVDEVFVGEVTDRESLEGCCDSIDVVFSSVGITRQREGFSFMDVDYRGNLNLLEEALKSGVEKFVLVSVYRQELFQDLEIGRAREMVVKELERSGIKYTVIRPTGFFSDASEFLRMALSGGAYLVGKGDKRINPIHGEDLAKVCVDASEGEEVEVPVGGPDVYTYREIAEMAFSVVGKKPKIVSIPPKLANLLIKPLWLIDRHYYTLARFFLIAMQNDFVAPPTGSHHLEDYFRELLPKLVDVSY